MTEGLEPRSSFTIGTPSAGGALKIYFEKGDTEEDLMKKITAAQRIYNTKITLKKIAAEASKSY